MKMKEINKALEKGYLTGSEYSNVFPNLTARNQYMPFLVGDVVTRDGSDEHLVYEVTQSLIGVVCIKEPSSKWTKISETELNMNSRYSFLYKHCNHVDKLKEIIALKNIDDNDKEVIQESIKL